MNTLETGEAPHRWDDLDHWRRELRRKPPEGLALAWGSWRRGIILEWVMAAGGHWLVNEHRLELPELPPCPAASALRRLARELGREGS